MKKLGKRTFSRHAPVSVGDEKDRVELATKEKLPQLMLDLQAVGVSSDSPFEVFFRAFKHEKTLEAWVKNRADESFVLLKKYPVCKTSGILGPKRREGDQQVPEGFYEIDRFNPKSKFHLSLRLNYPNESDKMRSDPDMPGRDIYLHGGCASTGCLAMSDDFIKKIYVLAELASQSGQERIEVQIFPTKMTEEKLERLFSTMPANQAFWVELLPFYQFFEEKHQLPIVVVSASGAYQLVEKTAPD